MIRDGKHQTVPARDLVVGDVVTLSMGDRVPADLRLVQISSDVRFDRLLAVGASGENARYLAQPNAQPRKAT